MTKANEDWTKDAKPILLAAAVLTFVGVASAYDSDDDLGYTRQVKCEQKEDGRQVQCWLVEVPNKPVRGIDTPLEEDEDDKAD